MSENTEKQLKQVISELFNIKEEKITAKDHFIKDLKADSLDVVELVMSVEEKFNISIADEEAEKVETVQDFLDLIKKKL